MEFLYVPTLVLKYPHTTFLVTRFDAGLRAMLRSGGGTSASIGPVLNARLACSAAPHQLEMIARRLHNRAGAHGAMDELFCAAVGCGEQCASLADGAGPMEVEVPPLARSTV